MVDCSFDFKMLRLHQFCLVLSEISSLTSATLTLQGVVGCVVRFILFVSLFSSFTQHHVFSNQKEKLGRLPQNWTAFGYLRIELFEILTAMSGVAFLEFNSALSRHCLWVFGMM